MKSQIRYPGKGSSVAAKIGPHSCLLGEIRLADLSYLESWVIS